MEYSDFYDYTSSYPEEGEREGGAGDGEEEVDVPAVLDGQGWQLVLPSGAVAGHRSLARYGPSACQLRGLVYALATTQCTSLFSFREVDSNNELRFLK